MKLYLVVKETFKSFTEVNVVKQQWQNVQLQGKVLHSKVKEVHQFFTCCILSSVAQEMFSKVSKNNSHNVIRVISAWTWRFQLLVLQSGANAHVFKDKTFAKQRWKMLLSCIMGSLGSCGLWSLTHIRDYKSEYQHATGLWCSNSDSSSKCVSFDII